MFKRVNQDLKLKNAKPPLKKRNIFQSKKMEVENIVFRCSIERYVSSIRQSYVKNWSKYETVSLQVLSKQDKLKRNKIFSWLFKHVKTSLTLKMRTIELTIKLLDIYQSKKQQQFEVRSQSKIRNIYPSADNLILDTITCLHLSCKYNQIYPPQISDILCLVQTQSTIQNILENECNILQTLDLNLNVSIVSDWYKIINKEQMPCWATFCYLEYEISTESKIIAQQITNFINKMCEDQNNRQKYLQLARLSQLDCLQTTKKLLQAFNDYKLRKQISKLCLNDETIAKQNNE